MNTELTERLAKEADDFADAQTQSKGGFHPNWHEGRDAKFAALVAEECAKICDAAADNTVYAEWPNPEYAASEIREKFPMPEEKS